MAVIENNNYEIMSGIYQPALQNRFQIDVIDVTDPYGEADVDINDIFKMQAIKASIKMEVNPTSKFGFDLPPLKGELKLELESEVYGLVAEKVSQLNQKVFDMVISVLDGNVTAYYKEHLGNCKFESAKWAYDYADSKTVKYLLTFTFDTYKVDRSYWLQAPK